MTSVSQESPENTVAWLASHHPSDALRQALSLRIAQERKSNEMLVEELIKAINAEETPGIVAVALLMSGGYCLAIDDTAIRFVRGETRSAIVVPTRNGVDMLGNTMRAICNTLQALLTSIAEKSMPNAVFKMRTE